MSAVANTSAASTSLKRSHDFSSDDDDITSRSSQPLFKRLHGSSSDEDIVQQRYFYVLAPESSTSSSEGTESVYSVQAKSTDLAHDTSDTSSKGSMSSDDDTHIFPIELEVVSLSESDRQFPFANSSTSAPEDVVKIPWPISEAVGRSSQRSAEASDDDGAEGRLKSRGMYNFCTLCKRLNSDPHFMLCVLCYRLRRSFLPERPTRKRSRAKKIKNSIDNVSTADDAFDSGVQSQNSTTAASAIDSSVPFDDNPGPSSFPTASIGYQRGLCQICLVRPLDGGFCHDRITHVYSCYSCTSKTFKQRGRCPVCNQRIKHVSRLIMV